MANIRPFNGLRYSADAGDLNHLVAPPYDVISPEEREALAAQSEFNVVGLTLPEQNPDDRSKYVKYARSASRLEKWVETGTLKKENTPAYYRLLQTFALPNGQVVTRQALIATIKVETYDKGVVLPHEQTFPKHKEDRLRVLEATRSHLECIYGLYEDPGRAIFDKIQAAPAAESHSVTTPDGVVHVLEPITDSESCQQISKMFEDRKVWIADGHHRYETACTFRGQQPESDELIPEDFMMMALSSMEDPGLVLLPTHRMVHKFEGDLKSQLEAPYWILTACPNDQLIEKIEKIGADGNRVFGIALPGDEGLLLTITDFDAVLAQIPGEAGKALKSLDVSILHDVIFAKHLGLTGHDFFGYTRDPDEAVNAVNNGFKASFLMNPPSVHDMKVVALGGEKMPQKSTYYYPKIISGLVIWRLCDYQS